MFPTFYLTFFFYLLDMKSILEISFDYYIVLTRSRVQYPWAAKILLFIFSTSMYFTIFSRYNKELIKISNSKLNLVRHSYFFWFLVFFVVVETRWNRSKLIEANFLQKNYLLLRSISSVLI
jgi:hypothetical protein